MRMEELDRPPAAVFTQSATIGQMDALGIAWPEAHSNAKMMAKLGAGQAEVLGFEAVRASFCLTAEAERLGCKVDPGKKNSTPMLKAHPHKFDPMSGEYDEPHLMDPEEFLKGGRVKTVLEAVEIMKKDYGDKYPVIAGNTGPFTLAGHLVSTENLVFGILMAPDEVHKWLDAVAPITKIYSQALADAGADFVQMSEPSSSTDLLSPDMFTEYSGKYIKDGLGKVKGAGTVLHICGNTMPIIDHMIETKVTGLSIEEKVKPVEGVKAVNGRIALVGNIGVVSPLLQGTPEDCAKHAKIVAEAGFNVVSSGCGLSAMISNENLLAVSNTVKSLKLR